MEREQTTCSRLENALISFVERVAKKDATPEEVEALPKVAMVLSNLLK